MPEINYFLESSEAIRNICKEESSLNEGIQKLPDLRYTNLIETLQTEIKDD